MLDDDDLKMDEMKKLASKEHDEQAMRRRKETKRETSEWPTGWMRQEGEKEVTDGSSASR